MKTMKLQVFDPPMCCPGGACGPNVDPRLARFSSDLDWLRKQGIVVERFSLSSDPTAFAEQDSVRQALENEGSDCLPLIVVNGSVVHKRGYPSRAELARVCDIVTEAEQSGDPSRDGLPAKPADQPVACGPACNCGAPLSGGKVKAVICVIVVLAIAGILAYKVFAGRQQDGTNGVAGPKSAFTVASVAENTRLGNGAPPQGKVEPIKVAGASGQKEPVAAEAKPAPTAEGDARIGKYLESLSELNTVALDRDAVFIFVPAGKDAVASEGIRAAVLSAQKALGSNNIKAGLYTLQVSSPDYSTISRQVQLPAVLVASKFGGLGAVSGEVTETTLLQAFMASSRGAVCGPSGCCPSACQ